MHTLQILLLIVVMVCLLMQPTLAFGGKKGKKDMDDIERQREEMKARIESQLPPQRDDDTISSAELGMMELARSVKNPKLLAQAMEDLKDPEIAAQVSHSNTSLQQ